MMLVNLSSEQVATIRSELEYRLEIISSIMEPNDYAAEDQAIHDALAALDTPAQQSIAELEQAIKLQNKAMDAMAEHIDEQRQRIAKLEAQLAAQQMPDEVREAFKTLIAELDSTTSAYNMREIELIEHWLTASGGK